MNVLLTGASGTLGPVLHDVLRARGHDVTPWDRGEVSPDDSRACEEFLDRTSPDAIAHLALGAERWAEVLAAWAEREGRRLLYTSTAMVFDHDPDGPHRPGDARSGRDDYGRYKARCEDGILGACPSATVARIGWQIGIPRTGGNDMHEHLAQEHAREGVLRPSRRWVPACSLLPDTAAALADLLEEPVAGVVHLDGNAESAWTFEEVVRALARTVGASWQIEPSEDYVHDQRLLDEVVRVRGITETLGGPR